MRYDKLVSDKAYRIAVDCLYLIGPNTKATVNTLYFKSLFGITLKELEQLCNQLSKYLKFTVRTDKGEITIERAKEVVNERTR